MTPDRTDSPPEPQPVGFCAVCHEEVYVWEQARDWTGNLVHEECKENCEENHEEVDAR